MAPKAVAPKNQPQPEEIALLPTLHLSASGSAACAGAVCMRVRRALPRNDGFRYIFSSCQLTTDWFYYAKTCVNEALRTPKKGRGKGLAVRRESGLARGAGRLARLGKDVLPRQRSRLPMWRVLYYQYLEHTEKRAKPCGRAAPRGR